MKYSNHSLWKRYVYSPVTLILILIVFVILVRATWKMNQKVSASSLRLAQAQVEFEKLETRQGDLSTKINKLSSEDGLKSEIRSKYRAVKQGESVAVIIEDGIQASSTASSTSPHSKSPGFWSRIFQKIGFGG